MPKHYKLTASMRLGDRIEPAEAEQFARDLVAAVNSFADLYAVAKLANAGPNKGEACDEFIARIRRHAKRAILKLERVEA